MLRLETEQLELIAALERRRLSAGLAPVLAQVWPAAAERLAERWPAFVATALERAAELGLTGDADQARFVGLCGLRGLNFDWARDVIDQPAYAPPLKLFQLMRRARGALPAAGPFGPAQFDAALAASDRAVAALGRALRVFTDVPPDPPRIECDLAQVALALGSAAPLILSDAPEEELELAVLAPVPLKLAAQTLGGCGKHPELLIQSSAGRETRRDDAAKRLALTLPAPIEREPGLTGIAHSPAPETHRFSLSCCGLREAGAPFGGLSLAARAYPRTAWKLQLRHGLWTPARFPEPEPLSPAGLAIQLEADDRALDPTAWRRDWFGLQTQWRAGLERLFNAWGKDLDMPTLEADASLLAGEARLAWGWREASEGISMQWAGRMDWLAAQLDLKLAGLLRWGDASAELRVACQGRSAWQQDLTPETPLAEALCAWRYPLQLTLLPKVGASPELLGARASSGAITGASGLRLRPDGRGWRWFCKVEVEPLIVQLASLDPLLGEKREPRTLIPGLTLVDWSAG